MKKVLKNLLENIYLKLYQDDLIADGFTKEVQDQIFSQIGAVENSKSLLKAVLKGYRIRYFNARNDFERERIRGEFRRTIFLLKAIDKPPKIVEPMGKNKLNITRYGA